MSTGYDRRRRSSEEYDQQQGQHLYATYAGSVSKANGAHSSGGGGGGGGNGYSVASTHDYLGYSTDGQPFGQQQGLWDDEEKEDLW